MTTYEHLGQERTHDMYDKLVEWKVIPDELATETDLESKTEVLSKELQKFEALSNAFYDKGSKGAHSTNQGLIRFLRTAMEAPDDTNLDDFIAQERWGKKHDYDSFIINTLTKYRNLIKRATSANRIDSYSEGIRSSAELLELDNNSLPCLQDVIFEKMENTTSPLPRGYGGELLLLFSQIQPKADVPDRVIAVAKQQAAARLRYDVGQKIDHQFKNLEKPAQYGGIYMRRVVGHNYEGSKTLEQIAQEELFRLDSKLNLEYDTILRVIEGCIASTLDVMYSDSATPS